MSNLSPAAGLRPSGDAQASSTGRPRPAEPDRLCSLTVAGVRHVERPRRRVRPTLDSVGVRNEIEGAAFADAVDAIVNASLRPEVVVDEIPAPQRIAPFAHAISGENP